MTAIIAGVLPGKLGPVLNFVAEPRRPPTLPLQHQEGDGPGSDLEEFLTETEPEAGLDPLSPFPYGDEEFKATIVKFSDAEILCDVCTKVLEEGECQMCWIKRTKNELNQTTVQKFWCHAVCFPTLCCQEGIERRVLDILPDHYDKSDGILRLAISETLATLLNTIEPETIHESQFD